jgi:hypothetical protein
MKLLAAFSAIALCISAHAIAQQNQQSGQTAQKPGRGSVQVDQGQTRAQKFSQMDKDKSGTVSKAEAADTPELVVIWSEVDADGDGTIDKAEFAVVPLVQPDGTASR